MIELASLCGTAAAAAAALSTPDPARKSCERGWALGTVLQKEGGFTLNIPAITF